MSRIIATAVPSKITYTMKEDTMQIIFKPIEEFKLKPFEFLSKHGLIKDIYIEHSYSLGDGMNVLHYISIHETYDKSEFHSSYQITVNHLDHEQMITHDLHQANVYITITVIRLAGDSYKITTHIVDRDDES